jgi:hypothetical protein
MLKYLLLTSSLLAANPALACHRFHVWRYPYPQRCQVAHVVYHAPEKKDYYVEIVETKPIKPQEPDLRTPEQIQESKEHDAAMVKYHDEINALMHLLHGESE